ncbi:FadR/GntR family transcriptional regulator [Vibrio fluminensis]|uniref:FadR/GntR family transcriptional regulator n=1 Tax=Vibrio fluminensis TaxID=2783614 RepID=UPI001888F0ED|nr:FadR/GntR family transcriptional regulator [Vibrio fluminensis]
MAENSKRLYVKVANDIIEQVKQGIYQVGDCIPPERKLAEQLGVSRTVVREAMVYLEMQGIADIRKGAGVFIVNDTRSLTVKNNQPEVTPFEILQARLMIEPQLARFAAENKTPELIEELSNCIKMMESSMFFSEATLRHQASVDADRQFHKAINRVSDNPLVINFYEELMTLHMAGDMWKRMDELADEPASRGQWIADHKLIFSAIEQGDGDKAYQCIHDHIMNVIVEITE